MKKIVLLVVLCGTLLYAQKDSKKTVFWQTKGIISLNLSQTALDNWTKGGDNSFALSFLGDFHADYHSNSWILTNYMKLTWGSSKVGSDISKITDNELIVENVLSKGAGWFAKPYASNTLRTQLVNGYSYDVTPKVQVSGFFNPAYLTQEVGLIYDKIDWFKTRFGVGFKETVTNNFNTSTDNPDTKTIEKSSFETGISSVSEMNIGIAKNISLKSKLSLFGRFENLGIWDVYWDNTLTGKVNDFVNVNVNVLVVYNRDESVKTQVKEALQLGISYAIF